MAQPVYRIGSQIIRVGGGSGPWRQVSTFVADFFISTTGSDSNNGLTPATAWAITAINSKQATYAGKNVGVIAGTYDVSSLMTTDAQDAGRTPVMNINGGPDNSHRTVIASVDSSGNYAEAAAIIDAKGASGFWGGKNDSTNAVVGCAQSVTNRGFWTLRGLKFTGFSLWCVHIGNSPSGGAPVANFTVQDCEFYGGDGSHSTVANGANLGPWIVYAGKDGLFTNNYCHDNIGYTATDTIHFSCLYQWGLGSAATSGMAYTYNTIKNSGNFQGKEPLQYNTTIAYNYIDMTSTASTGVYTAAPIFGFMSDSADPLATLTSIHHNVCVHRGSGISVENANPSVTYVNSPVQIYNNTHVAIDGQAAATMLGGYINGGATHKMDAYNNLYYDNGVSVPPYGYALTAIDMFNICAYNLFGAWALWCTVPNNVSGSTPLTTYSTLASWLAAIGGGTHPTPSATNPFTNNGNFAKQFQVQSGSNAFQTGKVGGLPGGAACNIGAWDGTVTRLGSNLAAAA